MDCLLHRISIGKSCGILVASTNEKIPAAVDNAFPGPDRLIQNRLFLVGSDRAVFATHADIGGTAVDALIGAVAVDVLSGGGLQAAVPIRGRPAVDAALFIIIVLM
jgi:hypothetical protein